MQEVDDRDVSQDLIQEYILPLHARADRIHYADRPKRSQASQAAHIHCFRASCLFHKPAPRPPAQQRFNRSALCPAFCRPRSQT